MRNFSVTALGICATFAANAGCANGTKPMQETFVTRTEERLQAANRGDKAEYGKDLLAGGIFTDGNGIAHTTKEMIDDVAPPSPPRVLAFVGGIRDVRFVHVGDTAVLNYILEQSDRIGDRESLLAYRKTDVFAKVNGVWTLIAMQASVIPAAPATSTVTPAASYAGDYEIAPGVAATIGGDGGDLRVEYPGETPSSFVVQSDASVVRLDGLRRIVFERNAAGRVIGLTFRRYPGGGDMTAHKTR